MSATPYQHHHPVSPPLPNRARCSPSSATAQIPYMPTHTTPFWSDYCRRCIDSLAPVHHSSWCPAVWRPRWINWLLVEVDVRGVSFVADKKIFWPKSHPLATLTTCVIHLDLPDLGNTKKQLPNICTASEFSRYQIYVSSSHR